MEFVAVELYANEPTQQAFSSIHAASRPKETSSSGDNNTSETSSHPAKISANARQDSLQPDYLAPIPDKASAFECFEVVADKGIFGGRHDGTVFQWKMHQTTSVTPLNVTQLRGHMGAVSSMVFCPSLGKEGLLFTGSADRSIKVWDPWRGSEAEQQLHGGRHDHFCVQTLPAHQASVVRLKLFTQQQRPALVSCSLDHTIRIWTPAEGRGLLLYPWYVLAQSISLTTTGSWPTSLCIRDAATSCSLFVGDSSGCVSHFTSGVSTRLDDEDSSSSACALQTNGATLNGKFHFKLKRKHAAFHSLGVVDLQLIGDNNLVVSLGFDQKAHILDAMTGTVSATITNRNATRFTSCAWDARSGQLLFLADAIGHVHIWNVFEDKWVKRDKLVPSGTPILTIQLLPMSDWLFTGIANGMKQWKISRDAGYGECTGHRDAIVGFAILRDEALVERESHARDHMTTCSRFFSVSLDNTLRCWDAYDMKAAFGFEEKQSEITCIATAKKFAKIVTGHECGHCKAWGIHTGQFVCAALPSKSAVTCIATGVVRDQEFVIVGDVDGNIFIWELTSDSMTFSAALYVPLSDEPNRRDEISALMFCKGDYITPLGGSEFVLIGYQTGHVAIWSFGKKQLIKVWKAHDDAITSIARHGCFVFTGSDDTTLRMWNCFHLADPYQLGVLRPPGSSSSSGTGATIVAVDVVQKSGAVICAAADGTVIVWDYKAFEDTEGVDYDAYGKILHRTRHDHQLRCMNYWPAIRSVLCGTSDGRILVLSLPPQVFEALPLPDLNTIHHSSYTS